MSPPPPIPPDAACPRLRTDAERNRGRVLAAARDVFAEQGLDAPMTDVARRAEVGIATLYRRFPTREDLITATFADKMTAYADAIDAALADPTPGMGSAPTSNGSAPCRPGRERTVCQRASAACSS